MDIGSTVEKEVTTIKATVGAAAPKKKSAPPAVAAKRARRLARHKVKYARVRDSDDSDDDDDDDDDDNDDIAADFVASDSDSAASSVSSESDAASHEDDSDADNSSNSSFNWDWSIARKRVTVPAQPAMAARSSASARVRKEFQICAVPGFPLCQPCHAKMLNAALDNKSPLGLCADCQKHALSSLVFRVAPEYSLARYTLNIVHVLNRFHTSFSMTLDNMHIPVSELIQRIFLRGGYCGPFRTQRLFFGGVELEPTLTVASYGIPDGATIHMVLQRDLSPPPAPKPDQPAQEEEEEDEDEVMNESLADNNPAPSCTGYA